MSLCYSVSDMQLTSACQLNLRGHESFCSADMACCVCVCVCVQALGQDTTDPVLGSRPGLSAHTGSLLALEWFRFQRCILLQYFSESTLSN